MGAGGPVSGLLVGNLMEGEGEVEAKPSEQSLKELCCERQQ